MRKKKKRRAYRGGDIIHWRRSAKRQKRRSNVANGSRRGPQTCSAGRTLPSAVAMRGDSFDVAPGLPSYIPPSGLMRDPCSGHGESQVAREPGADAQVVFQVKTQRRSFPVHTNTPVLNRLACSWNSIYFCQRGDLDIMRAVQEILLAAIYHPVER